MKIEAELLERVKAATGPDRELDRALSEAFGEKNDHGVLIVANRWLGIAPFSESIDTALALVEWALPEANAIGLETDTPGYWCAYVSRNSVKTGHWYFEAVHTSRPLAILVALLSALEAQP